MTRKLMLAALAAMALAPNGASLAQSSMATSTPKDAGSWTSSVDLAMYLPCSQWRRNPDGSWLIPGTVQLGSATLTDVSFGHGREADILDKRCRAAK